MKLEVNKDYNLKNLVKDWGFELSRYEIYYKYSKKQDSSIYIFDSRDVFICTHDYDVVEDEIICLLYDLIKAGIIIKV